MTPLRSLVRDDALTEASAQGSALRWLSVVIGLGALLLSPAALVPPIRFIHELPVWFVVLQLVPFGISFVALIVSFRVSILALRVLWLAYAAGILCAVVAWFTIAETEPLWYPHPWVMQAMACCAVTLALGWRSAVGYNVVLAVSAPASAFAFRGEVSSHLVGAFFPQLANIVFIAICVAINSRILSTVEASHADRAAIERLAASEATAHQQRVLAGVVHDEVLATLSAIPLFGGRPDDAVMRAVADADAALDELISDHTPRAPIAVVDFVAELRRRIAQLDARVAFTAVLTDAERGLLPADVSRLVEAAALEAVRNSVKHAGPDADRAVRLRSTGGAELSIEIHDTGIGFVADAVEPRRLGISHSITARMAALPGGSAQVTSTPGVGTSVRLGWRSLE